MLGFLVKQKLKLAKVCEDSVRGRGGSLFQAKETPGAKKAPKERLLDLGTVRGIWEEWTEGGGQEATSKIGTSALPEAGELL